MRTSSGGGPAELTSLPAVEEHPNHLRESDGAEGEDEEEADHVQFASRPPDGDLSPDPGGEGVGSRVGEVVADSVLTTPVP